MYNVYVIGVNNVNTDMILSENDASMLRSEIVLFFLFILLLLLGENPNLAARYSIVSLNYEFGFVREISTSRIGSADRAGLGIH